MPMKISTVCFVGLFMAGLGMSFLASVQAAITAEQRKEIADIKKEVDRVQGLITKKNTDEAEKILTDSDAKLRKIAKDANVKETDPSIASILRTIELRKATVGKKKGGPVGGGVSFSKDIAPILSKNCLNCHGANNPRGGLRMDNFAEFEQQGQTKPLLIPGQPNNSLLIARLTRSTNQFPQMPRGAQPLATADVQKIAQWIAQGAKFDGMDKSTALDDLETDKPGEPPVQIAKASGNETVSFSRDIAPFMVNLCVGCHGGQTPRSGFSLETFEKLMRGGRSGRVVLPGNSKDSRLWHLVGEQDPIKMPMGQALITRTNHRNLRTWIDEGAKFDGMDAKALLRTLVPTEAETKAKEIASLTAADVLKMRKDRIAELWKLGLPNEKMSQTETSELIVAGNANEARLKEVSGWGEDNVKMLKRTFNDRGDQVWKGKLAVFVFKDRFSYEEFARATESLEVPKETLGHAKVTSTLEEAYVCLEDIGDTPSDTSPGLKVTLLDQLTAAMMARAQRKVPDWVARGTGLALAAKADPKNPYFAGLFDTASDLVKAVSTPAEIFNDGTFSSGSVGPIGFTLVVHMLQVGGGESKFVQFLNQLQTNGNLNGALRSVYSADTNQLANSYLQGLAAAKAAPNTKKKK